MSSSDPAFPEIQALVASIPDDYDIYPSPGRSSASFTPRALLLREPAGDACQWLREHAKHMWSVTDTGVTIREDFAQLLILEATGMPSLVNVVKSERLSNFFRGEISQCCILIRDLASLIALD